MKPLPSQFFKYAGVSPVRLASIIPTMALMGIIASMSLFAQRPTAIVQVGHTSDVTTWTTNDEGSLLATASDAMRPDGQMIEGRGEIKIWDVSNGILLYTIPGPTSNALCFGRSSPLIASSIPQYGIGLYDLRGVMTIDSIKAVLQHPAVLDFSPDDRLLTTAAEKGAVQIWTVATRSRLFAFRTKATAITSIRFSRDGAFLACAGDDSTITLVDVARRTIVRTFRDTTGAIASMDFSPDRSRISYATSDGYITIVDVSTAKSLERFRGLGGGIMSLRYDEEGTHLLYYGNEGASVRDLQSGSDRQLPGAKEAVWGLGVRNHQPTVVVTVDGGFDATTGDALWKFPIAEAVMPTTAILHPSNSSLISGAWDGVVRTWGMKPGSRIESILVHDPAKNDWSVQTWTLAIDPKGERLVTDDDSATVAIRDVRDGRVLLRLGEPGGANCAAFSPGGDTLAVGLVSDVMLWDIRTGEELGTVGEEGSDDHSFIAAIDFSPDGRRIVTGGGTRAIQLWDLDNEQNDHTRLAYVLWGAPVSFSPNGRTFAGGDDEGNIRIWDTTGKELYKLAGHNGKVTALDFNTMKPLLASGGQDGTVRLWDVRSGKMQLIGGHQGELFSVRFSSDGTRLVSSGSDRAIKLWDVASGRELLTLIYPDSSSYLAITADGYYTCSKQISSSVAFRVGMRGYPFSQFDIRLNRPDKVLQALGSSDTLLAQAYHDAYRHRLNRMGLREEMFEDRFQLPEVSIREVAKVGPDSVRFTTHAEDRSSLLDRINVYVNGVPVHGIAGIDLRPLNTRRFDTTITIASSSGENRIEVSASNRAGTESLKASHKLVQSVTRKPEAYVIAVGVSDYRDTSFRLHYAHRDANSLCEFWQKQTSISRVHTIRLIDHYATREAILAVRDTLERTHPDDLVLLSFSGHGLLDKDPRDNLRKFFFATVDIDFDSAHARGVSYDEIESLFDGIPARRKLLLLDACHSGELESSADSRDTGAYMAATQRGGRTKGTEVYDTPSSVGLESSFDLVREVFADLRRGTGAVVISAARGYDYAYELETLGNGVFTHAVLEALREAVVAGKELRVTALREAVFKRVEQSTKGRQKPTSRRENLEFDFPIIHWHD